ncbi:MAG: PTS sugar transporter subunit IIB [Actinomycetes bacterium]
MIRVFAVCGMGLGTSAILKTRLRAALDATGVDYMLDVTDASAARGQQADLIFTSAELAEGLKGTSAKVVVVKNFMDREEINQKVKEAIEELQS